MNCHNSTLQSHSRRRSASLRAFTLIELMISLAIALAMILGVNQIFAISTQTVGAGEALGTISRADRTAHSIMWPDVHNIYLGPTPGFIINSQRVWAFRTRSDQAKSASGNPATGGGFNTTLSEVNHRIDTLAFFASGDLYRRQTGSGNSFVSAQTSTEAWIWYGHLSLPNNAAVKNNGSGPYFAPGSPTDAGGNKNDNNQYASEFILGRMAILLVPNPAGADMYLSGLDNAATASDGFGILSSRYDEAKTSITSFLATPALTTATARDAMNYRFQGNPFPTKPLSGVAMAGVSPVFIRNCSQFVVEYAGDYVMQDPGTGAVIKATPDSAVSGQPSIIDFVIDNGVRKVRWYGFPRDINGDGAINLLDVVPLRDVRASSTGPAMPPATGTTSPERVLPAYAPNYAGSLTDNSQYVCSWGPDNDQANDPPPKLLRITIALDDANGRLADSQIFEYVIDVQ